MLADYPKWAEYTDGGDLSTRAWINYGISKAVQLGITVENDSEFAAKMQQLKEPITDKLRRMIDTNSLYDLARVIETYRATGVDWPVINDVYEYFKSDIIRILLRWVKDAQSRSRESNIENYNILFNIKEIKQYSGKDWPELNVIARSLHKDTSRDITEAVDPDLISQAISLFQHDYIEYAISWIEDHPEIIQSLKDEPSIKPQLEHSEKRLLHAAKGGLKINAYEWLAKYTNILQQLGMTWDWVLDPWEYWKTDILRAILKEFAMESNTVPSLVLSFRIASGKKWPEIDTIAKGAKDLKLGWGYHLLD